MTTRKDLLAAKTNREIRVTEISSLKALRDENESELEKAVQNVSLSDKKALQRLTELLTLKQLFPLRIQTAELDFENSDKELLKVAKNFERECLSVRIFNQLEIAKSITTRHFEGVLTDSRQLRLAVENSDLVRTVNGLFRSTSAIPDEDALRFTERLLFIHQQSEALDSQLKQAK